MLEGLSQFMGNHVFCGKAFIRIGCIAGLLCTPAARAVTVTFNPVKDNTLIESQSGAMSNGTGEGIFCGRLASAGNGLKLRAVMAFDLASIPPGSTVTSASITLHIAQAVGGNQTHSLYKLLNNWGEGTSYGVGGLGGDSTPNDATWIHTFWPNSFWTTPGGDFVATASASQTVGNTGTFTWTSNQLKADVQSWINTPASNFGWIMRGNESVLHTAKKFVSREGEPTERPRLAITYTPPPPPCPIDITHDSTVNTADLVAVINGWGVCPAPPALCPPDVAPTGGNGTVDSADLLAVINNWGPCP